MLKFKLSNKICVNKGSDHDESRELVIIVDADAVRLSTMGHGSSLPNPEHTLGIVHSKLRSHLTLLKCLANLSYPDFLRSVEELNSTTSTFCDRRGKQLLFSVENGTDSSILWKTTVRIICQKVNSHYNRVESQRRLNLKQYVILYREIDDQVSNLNAIEQEKGHLSSLPSNICASAIFDGVGPEVDDNECCICMENRSEIMLPCAHQFCEGCIDRWNVTSKTCPICRERVESSDETWVLTEKPDDLEYETEVKGYLVSLADKPGHKT
ncbi:RING finger protein 141-like isoform X2 [Ostrea edulis]|uniref:RING finger protein 141-like isoform X2 n=1 Tax=Ostrea edulis TaxID=37623 RepID=UPI0020963BD4|nr:RING finger protein 141-like isoform X2 [Ostrea edulis]